jgi:DNA-binding GntR family transcriptional regulator
VNSPGHSPGGARSLSQQAYDRLESRLVTLVFAPGRLLQEKELCETLGIGRTPVREAVQRLAGYGLLRVLPRKGLQVAPIGRRELGRVIEARRVLERLLVVKAGERASPDQRAALQVLAQRLETISDDPLALFRLDRQLDALLAAACGNDYLVRALTPLHIHCRRLWYLKRGSLDMAASAQLHAHLARAVAEGDGAGAVRALNGIIAILELIMESVDDQE